MVQRIRWHDRALEDGEEVLKGDYIKLAHDVKKVVPKEKLQSFSLEDGFGWEQLCPAVGKPIPAVEYPRKNTPSRFDDLQSGFLDKAVRRAIIKATALVVVPLVATSGWYV